MPTAAYARTWGSSKPYTKPAPAPVLSTKSLSVGIGTESEPEPELVAPVSKPQAVTPPAPAHKPSNLWLIIGLGIGCAVFLLWAVVSTINSYRVLASHSRLLQNLIYLACLQVPKVASHASPPMQGGLSPNLEELLKSLQA